MHYGCAVWRRPGTACPAGCYSRSVIPPHTTDDNRVLTARGSRLLVQAPTDCVGSVSLLWYNPATQAEQWLIRPPAHVIGVTVAVSFYSRQNGNL